MINFLDKIKSYKSEEVALRKVEVPLEELKLQIIGQEPVRGFASALKKTLQSRAYALIAEIKKASPSKGLIREDFNPSLLAQAYEAGGATCLSILTDFPSFQGSLSDLKKTRQATQLPILRKDFLLDPYQVYEARAWGADCILIILALVDDDEAKALELVALNLEMDILLEVHTRAELERALCLMSSSLIGINNRDLKTFDVRLETSEILAHHVPRDRLIVSESGISKPSDLARLSRVGIKTFLVGESLMRQPNVTVATRMLLSEYRKHLVSDEF